MSKYTLEHVYRCWNDCLMQGCPSHKATLVFQSVSDSLWFNDGKGSEIYMQTPELEAFLCMINELRKNRVEIDPPINTQKASKPNDLLQFCMDNKLHADIYKWLNNYIANVQRQTELEILTEVNGRLQMAGDLRSARIMVNDMWDSVFIRINNEKSIY